MKANAKSLASDVLFGHSVTTAALASACSLGKLATNVLQLPVMKAKLKPLLANLAMGERLRLDGKAEVLAATGATHASATTTVNLAAPRWRAAPPKKKSQNLAVSLKTAHLFQSAGPGVEPAETGAISVNARPQNETVERQCR